MSSNLFESISPSSAPPPPDEPTLNRYRSLHVLTIFVGVLFALDVVLLFVNQAILAVLHGHDPGALLGQDPIDGTSGLLIILMVLASFGYMFVYVIGGVLFFWWLVRASRNARAMGARNMEFSPAWTVGCFFVPILNFFKPYEAVVELYDVSDPDISGELWGSTERPWTLLAWWLSWIAFGLGTYVGLLYEPGGVAALFPPVTGAVSAPLALAVLTSIGRRQAERYRRLSAIGTP